MNSLADNPQLRLIQARCARVFHVSELHFLAPHHGKMLETCVLISNSLEFWLLGAVGSRLARRSPGPVPALCCCHTTCRGGGGGGHIPPAPGARHQLEAIRLPPSRPPELFCGSRSLWMENCEPACGRSRSSPLSERRRGIATARGSRRLGT